MTRLNPYDVPSRYTRVEPSYSESEGFLGYAGDALRGLPHGVLSAASDVAALGGMPFGWAPEDAFGLMEAPRTFAGSLTSGATNFLTGFIPIVGQVGKLGKVSRIASIGAKLASAETRLIGAAQTAVRLGQAGRATRMAMAAKAIGSIPEFAKVSTASAITDLLVWDGHEDRFSNLIQDFPELENPITSFLQADEEDSEIEGRLKNALEGLALGSVADGMLNSFRIFRAGWKASKGTVDPSKAMIKEAVKIRTRQEEELKSAFNLNDDEARVSNILIDRMGLDRSRLRIVGGTEALELYDSLSGDLLTQVRRRQYNPLDDMRANDPLRTLLSPDDLASIKSRRTLSAVRARFRYFKTRLMPQLTAMATAGAPAQGGYAAMTESMEKVLGRSLMQAFSLFNGAFSPRQEVSAHTHTAIGFLSEMVAKMNSLGSDLRPLTTEEVTDMVRSVRKRLGTGGIESGIVKNVRSAANAIIAKVREAAGQHPDLRPSQVLSLIDLGGMQLSIGGRKTQSFAQATSGDQFAATLDVYMASLIPDSLVDATFRRRAKADPKLDIRKVKHSWLNKAEAYPAYSAALRQVAANMGLTPSQVQERSWAAIITSMVLRGEGLDYTEVFQKLRAEDLASTWNTLKVLRDPRIQNELTRLGVGKDVLDALDGVFGGIESRYRSHRAVGAVDPAAFAGAAQRVGVATKGSTGRQLKAFRKAAREAGELEPLPDTPKQPKRRVLKDGNLARAAERILKQQSGPGLDRSVRGFAAFADDAADVIGGFSGARFDTAVHELAHVARRQLFDRRVVPSLRGNISDSHVASAARWAGAEADGQGGWNWSIEAEEKFADGLVKYLSEGEVPAEQFLRRMYRQVSNWIIGLWQDIREVPDVQVSREMRKVFDALMNRGPGFEAPGAVYGRFQAPVVLAQATTGGGPGTAPSPRRLGRPAGTGTVADPYATINLERFSTARDLNEYVESQLDEMEPNALEPSTQTLEEIVREASPIAKEIDEMLGETSASEFLRNTELAAGGEPNYVIRQASLRLQAMRQVLASVTSRVHEVARKGAGASDEEIYEFLRGRLIAAGLMQEVKARAKQFAQALGAQRAIPVPKPISLLPRLPAKRTRAGIVAELPETAPVRKTTQAEVASGEVMRPPAEEVLRTPEAVVSPPEQPLLEGVTPTEGSREALEAAEARAGTEAAAAAEKAAAEKAAAAERGTLLEGTTPGQAQPGAREALEAAEEKAAAEAADAALESEKAGTLFEASSEESRARIIKEAIEEAGGRDVVTAIMERTAAAGAGGSLPAVAKLIRTPSARLAAAVVEYWLNSILSGPMTHMVNMTSNMIVALWLPFERTIGSLTRGDFGTARRALGLYVHGFNQLFDAVRLAAKAGWNDENILAKGASTMDPTDNARALSAAGFGIKEDGIAGKAVNWVGSTLNLPSRFLSVADEFFSQLNYRARMRSDLFFEGTRRFPKDAKLAAQWAEERFDKLLEDGQAYSEKVVHERAAREADRLTTEGKLVGAKARGKFIASYVNDPRNWDPEIGVMSKRNMEMARYATFTVPLNNSDRWASMIASKVQNVANEFPFLRFLFPFIRTPTNLLNFAVERMPLVNLPNSRQAFQILQKDAAAMTRAQVADAQGRLMTSLGVIAVFSTYISSGMITGGGPKNEGERKILEASGWQPYSIKIGDRYYSYRRFDPFATLLGLMADISEQRENEEIDTDELLAAITIAIYRNIANKTYLTGITNFANSLSNPEQYAQNTLNQLVGGLVPFSAMQMQANQLVLEEDPIFREVRTFMDAANVRLIGRSGQVPPRRNVFGEPIQRPELLGGFFPVAYTTTSSDAVTQELANLKHGFSPPGTRKGSLDLTTFATQSGQEAYDRWVELHGEVKLGGMTLRTRLERLMRSARYQRLTAESTDEYDSPRVSMIRSIIAKYRAAAYRQVLRESPALAEANRIDQMNRRSLRSGASISELQALMR